MALAEVNRDVAIQTALVSPASFTAHVRLTGEGGGYSHGTEAQPFIPKLAIPEAAREEVTRLLEKEIGPGRARLVAISTFRADPSEEYHEVQLREKPRDPSVHSNYGAFLKDKKGDLEGAEREYRIAIELDPNHVNALGNLANLLWEKGDRGQASDLYRTAFGTDPGNEIVAWNYARFLIGELNDRKGAHDVLDQGIRAHPASGRLLLLRGQLSVLEGNASEALEILRQARELGADQAGIEAAYAFALHLSSAPIGECIGAYRAAVALNPKNSALTLNLAQCLFVEGDDSEAKSQLFEAMRMGIDGSAQLEAQFYLLSHTTSDPAEIFRTMKSLLARGGRLRWDISPNIEAVARHDSQTAALLQIVAEVISGERDQMFLDRVLARWPSTGKRSRKD